MKRINNPSLTSLNLCVSLIILLGVTVYASAQTPTKPNVLLICVDDLRPELGSFGKPYIQSPNIDKLADEGRAFQRHYVQAPTCGASRYTLLTGSYGASGNKALFERSKKILDNPATVPPSMPHYFRKHGYTTVSVGKVSHHPGGRGGENWDDDKELEMPLSWDRHLLPAGPWQHPRGSMHGLAHGEIRSRASDMALFQATEGPDSIYPDGPIVSEGIKQLEQLAAGAAQKPFFLAVGIIRPHLPFGAPKKYLDLYQDVQLPDTPHPSKPMGKTTWHGSGEFMKYNRWNRNPNEDPEFATLVRKHYAACVSYADAHVGKIIAKLDALNLRENTIIILWGDHGWHLGEHAIWGKHALFEESLRSPLVIVYPGIPEPGRPTRSMVETVDIFPTLCELAGLPAPSFTDGVSLSPILKSPATPGHPAISYGRGRTIRTDRYRLIAHKDDYNELYDHSTPEGETKNIASGHPELVKRLTEQLEARLGE